MPRSRRGRNEGSIHQRADGLWVASLSLGKDADGKRRRKVVYGTSKKEVQDKLRKEMSDAGAGKLVDAERVILATVAARWVEDMKARGKLKPTTARRYDQLLRHQLVPHLGHVPVAKLTPLHVEGLYTSMAKAGDSADTQHKVGVLLGTMLQHAVRRKLLLQNPTKDVEKPRPAREEIRPLDVDQARQFLSESESDRLHAMYVVALDTGMRQGELFALQWEDIDWTAGTLQVRHSLEEVGDQRRLKEVKTRKGRRRIKLSPSALVALHEHRKRMVAEGNGAGPVFCNSKGDWLRKSHVIRRSFHKIIERINDAIEEEAAKTDSIPALLPSIRFHDLRHTCASLLLLANVNAKIVSERLGNSKIAITLDVYSHLLPTMQDSAAAQLETLLHRPRNGHSQATVAAAAAT